MRIANAAEPDWSEDTATLVYDLPARDPQDPSRSLAASATEPPLHARASAPGLSSAQIVTTVSAALIGAMAAAWSIEGVEEHALVAAPSAQDEVIASALPSRANRDAHVAAPAAQASVPTPAAAKPPEPPSTAAAIGAPAAQAATSTPEPAKASATAAQDQRKRRMAARARPSRRAQSRPAARSEPTRTAALPVAPAAAPRMGLLRVNSRPWSTVYVDGQQVGTTPQTAIELAPGRHTVALVSEQFELKRTLTVEVRAGETVTRSVQLLQ